MQRQATTHTAVRSVMGARQNAHARSVTSCKVLHNTAAKPCMDRMSSFWHMPRVWKLSADYTGFPSAVMAQLHPRHLKSSMTCP